MGRGSGRPKRVAKKPGAPRSEPRSGKGAGKGQSRQRSQDNPPRKRQDAAPRSGGGPPSEQIEGRNAVRELLLAGRRRVHEVLVAGPDDGRLDGPLADLVELAEHLGVPVRRVARTRLDALARTEAPQGVVAHADPLPEADLDDLITTRTRTGGAPFLVAVDGVTDPGNLGAVLRSAECAGASGVVLPRHRAVHVTPTVAKAAAGALEHLPIAVVGGLPAALERVKAAGMWVVGLDAGGDTPLAELTLADEPVLLVLGAEGTGLSRLVRARCDVVASIPLFGVTSSLNVAAAAAIATYEIARRRAASTA